MKWREWIYFPRISCRVSVKTLSVAWIVQLLVIIPVLISSQFCFCFFIHLSHHMCTKKQSDILPNLKWLHIQLYESTYCLCYILSMVRDVSLTPNFAGIIGWTVARGCLGSQCSMYQMFTVVPSDMAAIFNVFSDASATFVWHLRQTVRFKIITVSFLIYRMAKSKYTSATPVI